MQLVRADFHLPVSRKSVHGFFSGMRSAALPGRPRLALRRTFSAVLGLLIFAAVGVLLACGSHRPRAATAPDS